MYLNIFVLLRMQMQYSANLSIFPYLSNVIVQYFLIEKFNNWYNYFKYFHMFQPKQNPPRSSLKAGSGNGASLNPGLSEAEQAVWFCVFM